MEGRGNRSNWNRRRGVDKRGRKARQRGGKGIRERRLRVRSGVSERMVWEGRRKKKGWREKGRKI